MTEESEARPGNLDNLSNEEALTHIGQLIDAAKDSKQPEGSRHSLQLAEELMGRDLTRRQRILLNYFRANAWENIGRHAVSNTDGWRPWDSDELKNEIVLLRTGLNDPAFESLEALRQCQIFTNLANAFSHCGRFVEAIDYWDRALRLEPAFGMAKGNRAYGLYNYAKSLYDKGHQCVFLGHAYRELERTLEMNDITDDARKTCTAPGFLDTTLWPDPTHAKHPTR